MEKPEGFRARGRGVFLPWGGATPAMPDSVSVSQGYMPGGFNYTNDIKENAGFDEQKSLGYEIGFKSMFLDLFGSVGIMETEYDDYKAETFTGVISYDGNTMTYAPAYSTTLGARCRHESGLFVHPGVTLASRKVMPACAFASVGSYSLTPIRGVFHRRFKRVGTQIFFL